MQYWQIYRNWLLNMINLRLLLIGKGHRTDLKQSVENLKTLIEENGYRSNAKLAALISRKYDLIKDLLPNPNLKFYECQLEKLKMAVETGKTFIQNG